MATKLKTFQITGDSPYGGAGYLVLRWCKFLREKGWEVDVLATNPYWASELRKIPGLVVCDDIFIPRKIAPGKDIQALFQLAQKIRDEKYDVVHTYTATPGFLGRVAARIAGTPIILHHQAGWNSTGFTPLWQRLLYAPLEFIATSASTQDICVSFALQEQARQMGFIPMNKLVVICNGIDPEPFITAATNGARRETRQRLGIPDDHLLIGNTGRLAPQKDIPSLVEGMAYLRDQNPRLPFTLLLAGDGPEAGAIASLIHQFHLEDQVRMLGFTQDIPGFLAALDIFISPSLWEGLSISILEAMAAGKAIITTNILPNAELVDHENTGLLVEPRRPEQIALAAARFAGDHDLARRCGLAARQRVCERYSIERMFRETYELYQ